MKQIGDIAKELGIAASKLRYWEKQGLVRFERNPENNYRMISFQTIMDICDIIFYRDLAIPIEDILALDSYDYHSLFLKLTDSKSAVKNQIKVLKQRLEKIEGRLLLIQKIEGAKQDGFKIVRWNAPQICKFNFEDASFVRHYLEHPQETVALFAKGSKGNPIYGYHSDDGEIIYKADAEPVEYLKGLFWNCAGKARSNLSDFLDEAQRRNYATGDLIGEYLITTGVENRTDYYWGRLRVYKRQA